MGTDTHALSNQSLYEFLQKMIQTPSLSGEESALADMIAAKMRCFSFDSVTIDPMGNVIGRIGSGPRALLFDGHMDTVRADDRQCWSADPFSGQVQEGRIYGRGSADMKSGLAAAIYAASRSQEKVASDQTVYVTATVDEEFCDGVALGYVLDHLPHQPEAVVICEPSDNCIVHSQRGKALLLVETRGKSSHGSAPELGINAVYEMAEIIQRVQKLSLQLLGDKHAGSITLSEINSHANSLNAVPDRCAICLDRRLSQWESQHTVSQEMATLIAETSATWSVRTLERQSWNGQPLVYHPFHDPWTLELESPLGVLACQAWKSVFPSSPATIDWPFSTNAVAATARGIPVLGFGPGSPYAAHIADESCTLDQLYQSCAYYEALIHLF